MEERVEKGGREKMEITVNLDDFDLEGTMADIKKDLISVSGVKLHQFLKTNTPKDKGTLASSWKLSETGESARVTTDIPYAQYPNDGTGVFGKSGKPITPKSPNGVLVFEKGGQTIFTRKVQGQKGQKFVEKSIEELERAIPLILSGGM